MNYKIKNIACALTLLACQAGTSNLFAAGRAAGAENDLNICRKLIRDLQLPEYARARAILTECSNCFLEYFIIKSEADESIKVLRESLVVEPKLENHDLLSLADSKIKEIYPNTDSIKRMFDRLPGLKERIVKVPDEYLSNIKTMLVMLRTLLLPQAQTTLTQIRNDLNEMLLVIAASSDAPEPL